MKNKSIVKNEAIPFILIFSGLLILALCVDFVLHRNNLLWMGRYSGYAGTLLIALSFCYSLRKRKIIRVGAPGFYLSAHEVLGWSGALAVLIHGGIHFNGMLAWLAMAAMLVTVISGLTGRVLLKRSKSLVSGKRKALYKSGMDEKEIEEKLYWDTVAVDTMKKWRAVHFPITAVFITLVVLHAAAGIFFWDLVKW